MRENALLGAAFFLVAPRAADGCVVMPFIQRLAQALGLHDLGVDGGARYNWGDATLEAFCIYMNEQIHAEPRCGLVAKRYHLTEFPGRIDMQQRERRLAGMKGLLRDVQKRA